ncbi:hypothetical protein A2841_01550 [Candidatus Kaiserbacteria bacterium RIFCSPHIGHO2_01_FULL_48_10]|uniref:Glycosyl transferase family 1 domain-containing protein n=1 Tax=Candidatus Kaiserbacteria bacterium RIFCSPHIGHO2_01_FULL_48_10 TaxID=1798476 RepID=A0A1F6C1Z9_9BACT|nr:MAG: hypothetical protein A2841_01550 [Candidatus Kaiserbacteria bacterium RIFCSPHIGHO2_01_FULL_48_10]
MRVAILTDTMDRSAMGTALYTRKLVEGLVSFAEKGECVLTLVHSKTNQDPLYERAHEMILPTFTVPKLSRFLSEAFFLWRTRNDFDIIHYPQESVYPLFWLSRANIILTVHSHIEGWKNWGLKVRYGMVYITLRFFSRHIAAILCEADTVKKSILRISPVPENKIHTIPLGVDDAFRQAPEKGAAQARMHERYDIPSPYILNPARVDPHKNIYRLIEAYASLKETHNISHTLVVGAKHWPTENVRVEKLIRQKGITDSVLFMPYIEDADMPALYAGADVMAYPSLHEGFGLPILESMAAGTPVVTSNIFSMPEVSGGAALLVDPENTEAIAAALWKILSDTSLYHMLREKGKEHAKGYSWQKMIDKVFGLYKQTSRINL